MIGRVAHRGPDDRGVWVEESARVCFGHTRLSIIDLFPSGHQPMVGPSGRSYITYNGEIYDYVERRRELEREGVQFNSLSDTEVILALYERYGLEFLQRLRGMFAFGLWDAGTRRLVLARDRLGKKPLYYCAYGQSLYFASEIKAVRAALHSTPAIDSQALDEYLTFGFIGGERTIYQGIRELPPGHVLVAEGPGRFKVTRYWEPRWTPKQSLSFGEAVCRAEVLIRESVALRLRADTPVGILLSGGIDSGLITAFASLARSSGCHTFTIGFDDDASDERPLARLVASRYETDHHEVVLRPDVTSLVPLMAWHYDEPFADASAIPTFCIAEYASRQVKVVLNGDGGDELFAGYRRHLAAVLFGRVKKIIPNYALRGTAAACLQWLPRPRSLRTPYAFCHRFIRGLRGGEGERIVEWFTNGFSVSDRLDLYLESPIKDYAVQTLGDLVAVVDLLGNLDRALAIDLVWGLPGDLLVKMDISTMAYGLEARSPLLDHELVEWANTLPDVIRLPGITTKPVLRELARRYLPRSVVDAPKRGFEVPLHDWLRDELREICQDLMLSRDGIVCSLFRRDRVETLLRDPQRDPPGWAQRVWILLMLAAWDRYARQVPDLSAVGDRAQWRGVG